MKPARAYRLRHVPTGRATNGSHGSHIVTIPKRIVDQIAADLACEPGEVRFMISHDPKRHTIDMSYWRQYSDR